MPSPDFIVSAPMIDPALCMQAIEPPRHIICRRKPHS
jgi:hypothetical protein